MRRSVYKPGSEEEEARPKANLTGRALASVCKTCHSSYLYKNKMPPICHKNMLEIITDPRLEDLTKIENTLIARNIPFMHIEPKPVSRMAALKGKMVLVPIQEESVNKTVQAALQLPRTPNEAELVLFEIKKKMEYKQTYGRPELANPRKMVEALKALKLAGNPYYQGPIPSVEEYHTRCAEEDPTGCNLIFPDISEVATDEATEIDKGENKVATKEDEDDEEDEEDEDEEDEEDEDDEEDEEDEDEDEEDEDENEEDEDGQVKASEKLNKIGEILVMARTLLYTTSAEEFIRRYIINAIYLTKKLEMDFSEDERKVAYEMINQEETLKDIAGKRAYNWINQEIEEWQEQDQAGNELKLKTKFYTWLVGWRDQFLKLTSNINPQGTDTNMKDFKGMLDVCLLHTASVVHEVKETIIPDLLQKPKEEVKGMELETKVLQKPDDKLGMVGFWMEQW